MEHNQEKMAIAQEKQAIHKQKNKPKPTFEESLIEMRATAIRLGYVNPDGTPTGEV